MNIKINKYMFMLLLLINSVVMFSIGQFIGMTAQELGGNALVALAVGNFFMWWIVIHSVGVPE